MRSPKTRPKTARKHYAADFETTTKIDDCRVWMWAMVEVGGDTPTWGTDIDSYLNKIMMFDSVQNFHNLKFDGVFILDRIMRAGFNYVPGRSIPPGHFSALIDKMGKYYTIKVCWRNGFITEFRDSLKKLPFSVEHIANAFKLPVSKGSIDYHKDRPKGYQPTPEEIDYACRDVLIPATALSEQYKQGMTKLTAGSDALNAYKKTLTKASFEKHFPVLSHEIDNEIRLAYRGGFTYAAPRFKGRMKGRGSVYDVNSLYPYVMYSRRLPMGEPHWVEGRPEYTDARPLFIVSLTFTAKIKPKHIPLVQLKGSSMFSETEYVEEITEPTTLSFTNIDLDMLFKHYRVNVISWNGGYTFRAVKGIFKDFIDYWSNIKATATGALREIAKLQLNSLYGKFASNPDVTGKYPVLEDDRVKLKLGDDAMRAPVYTAMGTFITSYAREIMLTAAQDNFDRFAYCDTDSLHLLGTTPPLNIRVDDNELGAWKHEGDFDKAFYIRAKGYMERLVTCRHGKRGVDCKDCVIKCYELSTHIAGVPKNIAQRMTFEDIFHNHQLDGKLVPKNVPGGVVLTESHFTLKL